MLAVIFYRFGWLPGLPERLMVLPWNSPNTRIVHTPRAACPSMNYQFPRKAMIGSLHCLSLTTKWHWLLPLNTKCSDSTII